VGLRIIRFERERTALATHGILDLPGGPKCVTQIAVRLCVIG
jgi:hypothetical protein